KSLLGQELTMRYAQRVAPPSEGDAAAKSGSSASDSSASDTSARATESPSDVAYSVISREQKLKIVGISDLDPDSMRGAARARVFLPLKLAQALGVMQP